MERQPNDFDQDIFDKLCGEKTEKPYNPNDAIDEITGQAPLRYYDPLKPIIDKLDLKIQDSIFGDFFGDTPAFI